MAATCKVYFVVNFCVPEDKMFVNLCVKACAKYLLACVIYLIVVLKFFAVCQFG